MGYNAQSESAKSGWQCREGLTSPSQNPCTAISNPSPAAGLSVTRLRLTIRRLPPPTAEGFRPLGWALEAEMAQSQDPPTRPPLLGWGSGRCSSHPTPSRKLLPSRGGGDWPVEAAVRVQRPKIGLASRCPGADKTRARERGARGLLRNAGSWRRVPAGPGEGVGQGWGSVPSLARAPWGTGAQSSSSSPSPRSQRRSMARGRDLGQWPGLLGQVARTRGSQAGRLGAGGGADSRGAESRPHLDHLLKGTVGQQGNLLDR